MSRGIARERAVKALKEAEGYWTIRAAASLGDADVVALKAGQPAEFIEVKSTHRGPYHGFGPRDRADLLAAARLAGAEAWLCWWPPRKPPKWIHSSEWPA
jgi:Holliday junction resolvase